MKIGILGYGKMGKSIEKIALTRNHEIVFKTNTSNLKSFDNKTLNKADVVIEFSNPKSALKNIQKCINAKICVVSGTTGWDEELKKTFQYCIENDGTLVFDKNFSLGAQIMFKLNEYLSSLMNNNKDYNVSVNEIHHPQKKDQPSGTALKIINDIKNKNNSLNNYNQIKVNSERIENIFGIHEIIYDSKIDTISIKHNAKSRLGFAEGAIVAAEWVIGKKGVYSMKDVIFN